MPEDENNVSEDNKSIRDELTEFLSENTELFSVENRIRSETVDNTFNSIQRFIRQYDELQQLGRFWELDDEDSEISRSLADVYKNMAALNEQEAIEADRIQSASGPTVADFKPEEVKPGEDEPVYTKDYLNDPNNYDVSRMQEPFHGIVDDIANTIKCAPMSDNPSIQAPLNRIRQSGIELLKTMEENDNLTDLSRQDAACFYAHLLDYKENVDKLSFYVENISKLPSGKNMIDQKVLNPEFVERVALSGKAADYMRKGVEQCHHVIEENHVDYILGLPERSINEPRFTEERQYAAMLKMIDDVDPSYIRSSADFRNAKKGITDIIKSLKNGNGNVDEVKMNEQICKAYDHTLLYLETKTRSIEADRKKGKEPSELALKRIAAMEKISVVLKKKLEASYDRNPNLKEPTNKDMIDMLRSASSKKPANKAQQEFMDAGSKYANMLEKDRVNLYEHFNKERANVLMNALVSEERFLSSSRNTEVAPKENTKKQQKQQMRL